MTPNFYLTKEQRVAVTNFLKWFMVDFDIELNEAIFEDYTSGINSTMNEGINNEILEALPKEVKIDIINKLFLSLGKISDLSLLQRLSQYLEDYMIGTWSESVMIHSIIIISQYFLIGSVRIVPMIFNKPISKLTVYLDNTTFEITTSMSSFTMQKFVRIMLQDKILQKVMEYKTQPSQFDVEELLSNLLSMPCKPIELFRCEYIRSSYKDMNYLDIKLSNTIHKEK